MNISAIAIAVAVASVALDCFTTYRGVFVKKVATEGDRSIFTQFFASKPWHLLFPPMIILAVLIPVAMVNTDVAVGVSVGVSISSAVGYIHNLKVNKGL